MAYGPGFLEMVGIRGNDFIRWKLVLELVQRVLQLQGKS